MKKTFANLLPVVLLTALTIGDLAAQGTASQNSEEKKQWPYPVPARIKDGANRDLFIMTDRKSVV